MNIDHIRNRYYSGDNYDFVCLCRSSSKGCCCVFWLVFPYYPCSRSSLLCYIYWISYGSWCLLKCFLTRFKNLLATFVSTLLLKVGLNHIMFLDRFLLGLRLFVDVDIVGIGIVRVVGICRWIRSLVPRILCRNQALTIASEKDAKLD